MNVLLNFVLEEWRLLTFLTFIFAFYFHYTSTFDYFEKKGIKFMKPTIFLGNLGPRLMLKISFHEFQKQIYDSFAGLPFGGFFEGKKPVLLVRDPELIKAVMIRDFDHFVDRNTLSSKQPAYINKSLLNLQGNEWKFVRSTLTPTFSSSRLRGMLPIIKHCSGQMVELLKRQGERDIEMKEFMGRFTLEVIGTCAFGIECDALKEEPSYFVKVAEKFLYVSTPKRILLFFFLLFMPKVMTKVNISFFNSESTDELVRMLNITKKERREKKERRNDFLQLLLDAVDSDKKNDDVGQCLDEDTIDAQTLLFLLAGYETSSTLLSFAVHVLATHQDIQDRLRQHVNAVLSEGDGEINYDTIQKMDYLESVLLETLRLYPPASRVDRVCTKPYTFPGSSVHVEEGAVVAVSVYGIHMDERFYPKPDVFDPERFAPEQRKERPAHLFLPFGAGPRNCIGLRFAMVSTKLAMAFLIREFKFTPCEKTADPVVFNKKAFLLKAALWVHVSPIK